MKKGKIKILMIEPMKHPKECYVKPTKRFFINVVDANIIEHGGVEAKRLEKNVYAVFNKDRFLTCLEPNRRIGDDIIVGNLLIVAINDDRKLISLTSDQASNYALRFWSVEEFDDMDIVEANLNTMFSKFLQDE